MDAGRYFLNECYTTLLGIPFAWSTYLLMTRFFVGFRGVTSMQKLKVLVSSLFVDRIFILNGKTNLQFSEKAPPLA